MSEDNFPVIQDRAPVLTGKYTFYYDGNPYVVENNKLYDKNHRVAVVYSPGFGGGWNSWYPEVDPTDARVAILALTGTAATLFFGMRYGSEWQVRFKDQRYYPYEDSDMGDDLDIEWVPAGTLYKIDEYDGAESVVTNSQVEWHIA